MAYALGPGPFGRNNSLPRESFYCKKRVKRCDRRALSSIEVRATRRFPQTFGRRPSLHSEGENKDAFFPWSMAQNFDSGSVGLLSGVFICELGNVASPVERGGLAGRRARSQQRGGQRSHGDRAQHRDERFA